VVPASAGPRETARLFDLYADAEPARVVLSRVDEAGSLAPLVAPLAARRARVSWLGTGQRVPEDLARATPSTLAAHVLGEPPVPGVTA
jgi:flagellar biosynthesis protein FlhF